jgi:Uma2 family endonuclease
MVLVLTTLDIPLHGWTVDDLDALPDDDHLHYELVDGCLLVTPPPVLRHQSAVTQLSFLLHNAIARDWRVLAEAGLRVDDVNFRVPDVMVIRAEALAKAKADPEDVLLAVEVMSQSSVSTDRVAKPAQYAAHGIPHFWRLELGPGPVLVTHVLADGVYGETGRFADDVAVEEPVPLRFRLGELLG